MVVLAIKVAGIVFTVKAFCPFLRISKIDKEDRNNPVFEIFQHFLRARRHGGNEICKSNSSLVLSL